MGSSQPQATNGFKLAGIFVERLIRSASSFGNSLFSICNFRKPGLYSANAYLMTISSASDVNPAETMLGFGHSWSCRFWGKGRRMTDMAMAGAGSDQELRGRIDQIERDLARILIGMDQLGDMGAGTSAPAPQARVADIGGGTSAVSTPGYSAAGMLRPGFGAKRADTGPQSFTRSRARFVRGLIRQRRQREHHFPADMFADPAWDMMLDLYAAHYEGGHDVSVSSLCIASAVPATTALRWIKMMTDAGFFVRDADPHDGRRIFIRLSESARSELDSYFDDLES